MLYPLGCRNQPLEENADGEKGQDCEEDRRSGKPSIVEQGRYSRSESTFKGEDAGYQDCEGDEALSWRAPAAGVQVGLILGTPPLISQQSETPGA